MVSVANLSPQLACQAYSELCLLDISQILRLGAPLQTVHVTASKQKQEKTQRKQEDLV